MKRLARTRNPTIAIEVIAKPIEVHVPAPVIRIEIRDVTVTVRVDYCAKYHPHHCPLNILRTVSYLGT